MRQPEAESTKRGSLKKTNRVKFVSVVVIIGISIASIAFPTVGGTALVMTKNIST